MMTALLRLWDLGGIPLCALIFIGAWSAAIIASEITDLSLKQAKRHEGLPVLGALAAIAPLVGLLGTVVGLVQIFAAQIAPERVADGIAQALLTTQVGLVIAVPTLFARQILLRLRERQGGES